MPHHNVWLEVLCGQIRWLMGGFQRRESFMNKLAKLRRCVSQRYTSNILVKLRRHPSRKNTRLKITLWIYNLDLMNPLKACLSRKWGSWHNGTYSGIKSMTIVLIMMMMMMIKTRIHRPMLIFIVMMMTMTILTWRSEMEDFADEEPTAPNSYQ